MSHVADKQNAAPFRRLQKMGGHKRRAAARSNGSTATLNSETEPAKEKRVKSCSNVEKEDVEHASSTSESIICAKEQVTLENTAPCEAQSPNAADKAAEVQESSCGMFFSSVQFESILICDSIKNALKEMNLTTLTEIQASHLFFSVMKNS